MTQLSSKPITNSGRQVELDIVRGLAVFFMVLIHIQEYYLQEALTEHPLGVLIDFLGGVPAAPVFMFLMGIGVVYSKSNNLSKSIKRGFLLIALGYVLNLLRGTLPALLQWTIYKDIGYLELGADQLIYVDIFQFSGLALILLGFVKQWKMKAAPLMMLILVFAGLNYITRDIETTQYWASALTGLFIGSSSITFFPFLSWIFYPLAGYLFGRSLLTWTNKNKYYMTLGAGALVSMTLLFGFFAGYLKMDIGLSSDYSYYHHQLIGNMIFTAFVLFWISLSYLFSKFLPKLIIQTLNRWSANVTEIYFIHWLLIGWLIPLLGYNHLSFLTYFMLTLLILISSDALARVYIQNRKK